MKLLVILTLWLTVPSVQWLTNFPDAQAKASDRQELILLNFSGSDWCGPCIRLRTEILDSPTFEAYAQNHLVLVRADFPRKKANQLPLEQVRLNEALAEKYNPDGIFPLTLLLTPDGRVLGKWEGFPGVSAEKFVAGIKAASSK